MREVVSGKRSYLHEKQKLDSRILFGLVGGKHTYLLEVLTPGWEESIMFPISTCY